MSCGFVFTHARTPHGTLFCDIRGHRPATGRCTADVVPRGPHSKHTHALSCAPSGPRRRPPPQTHALTCAHGQPHAWPPAPKTSSTDACPSMRERAAARAAARLAARAEDLLQGCERPQEGDHDGDVVARAARQRLRRQPPRAHRGLLHCGPAVALASDWNSMELYLPACAQDAGTLHQGTFSAGPPGCRPCMSTTARLGQTLSSICTESCCAGGRSGFRQERQGGLKPGASASCPAKNLETQELNRGASNPLH